MRASAEVPNKKQYPRTIIVEEQPWERVVERYVWVLSLGTGGLVRSEVQLKDLSQPLWRVGLMRQCGVA